MFLNVFPKGYWVSTIILQLILIDILHFETQIINDSPELLSNTKQIYQYDRFQ